jgi:hypothetical protein
VSQRSGYFLIVRATRSERSDEIHPNGIYLRLGLRDSNVTSIDTLPTEEFLDQIHIHGMRLASAHQPPRFRVLKPSALLGIGIAAQQFILQRLKPLLQDHIASQRPRDAPPEFYDDIDDEEQDIGDHIEVESGHSDDQPSTQLPESSNDLLLELPKDIRGRASESGLHETPHSVKQNPDNVPESSEAVDGNISDQEVPSTNKTRKRKERIVVESTAAAERPKRSKKS